MRSDFIADVHGYMYESSYFMKRVNIYFCGIVLMVCVGTLYGYVRHTFTRAITTKEILTIYARCTTSSKLESATCFRNAFKNIVNVANLKQIMMVLEKDAPKGDIASSFQLGQTKCHELAHVVGEAAGLMKRAPSSALISACGLRCGYGCAHGVIMGLLKKDPSILSHIETLCGQPTPRESNASDAIACYHGVGHGLAEYTRYNVPDALRYCNAFRDSGGIDACVTGVFMEVYSPADSSHEPIPIPTDLFSDCMGLSDASALFCKRMMIVSSYRTTHDIQRAFGLCQTLMRDGQEECVFALGADVYFMEQENVEQIMRTCALTRAYAGQCIQGAVLSSISIHANGTQALEICAKSGSWEPACLLYRRNRLQDIGIDSP